MTAQRLNKTTVNGCVAGEKDTYLRDTELMGFALKVTPKGRKVYIIDYRMPGQRRSNRFTIGRHGSPWTPDMARAEAKRLLFGISQGNDPNAEKRRRRSETVDYSFGAYADQFVEKYLRPHWPGSFDRADSILRCHARPYFGSRDIRDIQKADCAAFIDGLWHMEATARKAKEVVGKLFRWAEDRGDIERSPMERVPTPKPGPGRERVLSDADLSLVWRGTLEMKTHPYAPLVRFLVLSGQRLGEVGGMQWEELDFERLIWEIPAKRMKSNRDNIVPLTPTMVEVLEQLPRIGQLVFSIAGDKELGNHSKLKQKLDTNVGKVGDGPLDPWKIHDQRRTVATGLQRLGIGPDMIEVVQGRTLKLGAGGRYQRYDYLEEKRAALTQWNNHVMGLVAAR